MCRRAAGNETPALAADAAGRAVACHFWRDFAAQDAAAAPAADENPVLAKLQAAFAAAQGLQQA